MDDDGQSVLIISGIIFVAYLIFNLAWIIPDLIFAYQDLLCVAIIPQGFTINLSTWLQVDAYVRVAAISIVLMISVMIWVKIQQVKERIFDGLFFFILIVLIFTSVWAIVGSVMFWGYLNSQGLCTGGVQVYLFLFLTFSNILSAILCCLVLEKIRENRINSLEVRLLN